MKQSASVSSLRTSLSKIFLENRESLSDLLVRKICDKHIKPENQRREGIVAYVLKEVETFVKGQKCTADNVKDLDQRI